MKYLNELVNLTYLAMGNMSVDLIDNEIAELARSFQKLKIWEMCGSGLIDATWSEFACLKSLRGLALYDTTWRTARWMEFLIFIALLQPVKANCDEGRFCEE